MQGGVEHRSCYLALVGQRDLDHAPVGVQQKHCIGVVPEPDSGSGDIVGDDHVDSL